MAFASVRIALPILVFALGVGATSLAGHLHERSVRDEGLSRQREQAGANLRNLELGLASITEFNEGLAAHITTSQPLDRRSFDDYIAIREAFAPEPGLQSVAYLPEPREDPSKAALQGAQADRPHPGQPVGPGRRLKADLPVHAV